MGSGNQPNIDVDRFRTPQAFKFVLLQGTQKLRLQIETDVADLIQKEGAAIRQLEPAPFLHQGTGESAFFVAK